MVFFSRWQRNKQSAGHIQQPNQTNIMKNTTTNTARNSRKPSAAKNLAQIAKDAELKAQAETPQAETPETPQAETPETPQAETPFAEKLESAEKAYIETLKADKDAQPSEELTALRYEAKKIRLAEIMAENAAQTKDNGKPADFSLGLGKAGANHAKARFDFLRDQIGEFPCTTGTKGLSAHELISALCSIGTVKGDYITPTEELMKACKAIADEWKTSERTITSKVESAVSAQAAALRLKVIRGAIQFRDSLERINKQLEIYDMELTTQAEVDSLAKQYA